MSTQSPGQTLWVPHIPSNDGVQADALQQRLLGSKPEHDNIRYVSQGSALIVPSTAEGHRLIYSEGFSKCTGLMLRGVEKTTGQGATWVAHYDPALRLGMAIGPKRFYEPLEEFLETYDVTGGLQIVGSISLDHFPQNELRSRGIDMKENPEDFPQIAVPSGNFHWGFMFAHPVGRRSGQLAVYSMDRAMEGAPPLETHPDFDRVSYEPLWAKITTYGVSPELRLEQGVANDIV